MRFKSVTQDSGETDMDWILEELMTRNLILPLVDGEDTKKWYLISDSTYWQGREIIFVIVWSSSDSLSQRW